MTGIRCKDGMRPAGVRDIQQTVMIFLIKITGQGFGDPETCFFVQSESRGVITCDLKQDRTPEAGKYRV